MAYVDGLTQIGVVELLNSFYTKDKNGNIVVDTKGNPVVDAKKVKKWLNILESFMELLQKKIRNLLMHLKKQLLIKLMVKVLRNWKAKNLNIKKEI